MNTHCNRCGKTVDELVPEAPSSSMIAERGNLALDMESAAAAFFMVCRDCLGTETPFRYCSRCGHETPLEEFKGNGFCSWCRAAEDIPFEEPNDDEWWEEKASRAGRPTQ